MVNSASDTIKADDKLTLREAIALINNSLPLQQLSSAEKALGQQNTPDSRIEFNLPSSETTIPLQQELPALTKPGLIIDGTTQLGYNASPATAEIAIPKPVVAITPAPNKEILRGLTVVADNVQIRGLSIYGFSSSNQGATLTIPPADIFIDNSTQKQPRKMWCWKITGWVLPQMKKCQKKHLPLGFTFSTVRGRRFAATVFITMMAVPLLHRNVRKIL